jgi:hypothetical protein
MKIKWDQAKAIAGFMLAGSLGAQARGYLAGLAGQDPRPEREFSPTEYEEGWYQGYEEYLYGQRSVDEDQRK